MIHGCQRPLKISSLKLSASSFDVADDFVAPKYYLAVQDIDGNSTFEDVAQYGVVHLRGLTIFGTKTYAKARSGISRDSHKLIPSVQREDLIYEI